MAELGSDTVLQRAPHIDVELGSTTIIRVAGRQISVGSNVLPILEAFTHPITYSKAVKDLSARVTGVQGWIELVSTITNLYKAGVLVDEAGIAPPPGVGWAAPDVHVSMLNDRTRTRTFLEAIEKIVRPGDIVVDIGTGTGVLAAAAARAGARHVYAIEATGIGEAAKALFAANGLLDRITVIPGWSSQIELPERASVLIAEIIGNDPLEEGVMETFADARKRLLTEDARVIPFGVKVFALPVTVADKVLSRFTFTSDSTDKWREWYGLDFSSLLTSPTNRSVVFRYPPHEVREWPVLAEPLMLANLDLSGASLPLVNEAAELAITAAGSLSGLLVYFELDVAPGKRLTTSPAVADETSSWWVKVWLSETPVAVKPGDKLKVSYRYRADSSGTRIEVVPS
jgi:hypothetical protein